MRNLKARIRNFLKLFSILFIVLYYAFYPKDYGNEFIGNSESNSEINRAFSVAHQEIAKGMTMEENIHLLCILTKLDRTVHLKDGFPIFAKSVLEKTSSPIVLSVITDQFSRPIVEEILSGLETTKRFHEVNYFNVFAIVEQLRRIVSIMSHHFSSFPGTYYSDALFFLSLGLHHILGPDQHKVIVADVDMMFVGDIAELWREFDKFNSDSILGIAPELSPAYRILLHEYRESNPSTRIGEPLSENGFPGFNSGVLLLNLERIRRSRIFAKFIGDDIMGNPMGSEEITKLKEEVNGRVTSLDELVKKYSLASRFGDQDFYTLLGAEYPELIHVIPCVWNRQLCTIWAATKEYADIFDKYFRCEGKVKVYHGNCRTPFPSNIDHS